MKGANTQNPLSVKKFPISLLALVFCTACLAQRTGKDYAVFFYGTNFQSGWQALPETAQEATELQKELSTNYNFSCESVLNPSKQTIRNKIREYNQRITPNDQVFFFFSMHGYYNEYSDRGYLVASDGRANDPYGDTYLSYDDLRTDLAPCKAKHILLALDACHSGSFGIRSKGGPDAPLYEKADDCPTRINRTMQYQGRQYCSSGNKNAKTPAKSLFASRLLEALRKGGEGGIVQFDDLEYWIGKIGNPQPEIGTFAGHTAGGDFVFVRKNACNSTSLPNSGDNADLAAWRLAKQQNNIESYQRYIQIFPNGEFHELANQYLEKKKLELAQRPDEIAWQAALVDNTLAIYQKYQQDFPQGLHFKDAGEKIKYHQLLGDKMVRVKGGTFMMGCMEIPGNCDFNEKPAHKVTLSDFYIGKFEVTIGEYLEFANENPKYYPTWLGEDSKYNLETGFDDAFKNKGLSRTATTLPVVGITWVDAEAYCKWLSLKSGLNYRLPTEAEWEYAAREGGKEVLFGNGKNIADPDEINFNGTYQYKKPYSIVGVYRERTTPVGSFPPNALGLYDMSGNVSEWCSDGYSEVYYQSSPVLNPSGYSSAWYKVHRGGGWNESPVSIRVTRRLQCHYLNHGTFIGFRLAATP